MASGHRGLWRRHHRRRARRPDAQKVNERALRILVVLIGIALTIGLFLRRPDRAGSHRQRS